MSADRWSRVEDLFHRARALPAGRRAAFLDRACDGDEALRGEVDTLLAAAAGAEGRLQGAVARAAVAAAGDVEQSPTKANGAGPVAGRRIGAWAIERELGRGGMGSVYLARRADHTVEQTVAIKLLRGGVAGEERLARFRAERQILADLDHPSIARFLDGGSTEDGVPYLVMEHVDGRPIDRYCAEEQLGITARLQLFERVCEAVRSAHQSLVVHRDLKPSNILVTDQGVPKLLDFGIAKLLHEDSTALTATVDRVLTPAWASPEQMRGGAITTRSDVYALGLLLYLLLTGQQAHRFRSRQPAEIERVICERPPTRPSTVVTATAAGGDPGDGSGGSPPPGQQEASTASSESPEERRRLHRRLRGDLDTIVLHALAKEPERRYASVGELIEDLRRHREGLPVRARPATAGYRLRKFALRHRTGVVAASAILLLLVGLGVYHFARVTRERDRAQLEAAKANRVAAFLQGLFEASDPATARGAEITARQLLERGAERIEQDLAEEPEVQATMMNVVGSVSAELGDYERARELLERSLELRRRQYGPRHPEVAEALHDLAAVLAAMGELERSEEMFRQALDVRLGLFGEDHAAVASTLAGLGNLVQNRGRLAEAEELFRRALAIDARLNGGGEVGDVTLLNNLGRVLHESGQLEEAETQLRRAVALRRRRDGDLHPETRTSIGNLAMLLEARGRYEEAEALHREALELSRGLFGESHPQVGVALNNLASLRKGMGDYAEAESLQRQALAVFRDNFGDEHPRVVMCLNNLANLLHDQGELEAARALHAEALPLYRKLYGDGNALVAGSLGNQAVLLFDLGELEEAERLQREALEIDRRLLGDAHPYVAGDLDSLAAMLLEKAEPEAARPLIEEALRIKRAALGEDHTQTATTLALEGRLLLETGRAQDAEPVLRQALDIRSRALPADHPELAASESLLGAALVAQRRYAEAEPLLVHAHRVLEPHSGRYARDRRQAGQRLAALRSAMVREGVDP